MLKNVIKSYSFFYQFFLKTQQSQDRQGFALKAVYRKNKHIIFKNTVSRLKINTDTAILQRKGKDWLSLKYHAKLIKNFLRAEFFQFTFNKVLNHIVVQTLNHIRINIMLQRKSTHFFNDFFHSLW